MSRAQIEAELKRHTPIMWKLAQQSAKRWPQAGDVSDFFQQAVLGLLRAAEDFDASRGNKFLTYACWWMRNFVGRLGRHGALIRTPVYASAIDVHSMPLVEDDAGCWSALYPPARELRQVDPDVRDMIERGLRTLDHRSREIIEHRFGLNGKPVLTLAELGQKLGITRERIRQIADKAMVHLYRSLRRTGANPRR